MYFYNFVFPRKSINVIYPHKLIFGLDFRGGKEKNPDFHISVYFPATQSKLG